MQKIRWRKILAAVGIFICGVIVGILMMESIVNYKLIEYGIKI